LIVKYGTKKSNLCGEADTSQKTTLLPRALAKDLRKRLRTAGERYKGVLQTKI
jgi:hypothetical protein